MTTVLVRGELSADEQAQIKAAFPEAKVIAAEGDAFLRHLPDADIVWGALRPSQIARGKRLKLVQVLSAGVDHMLSPELSASQAVLCTASGIHQETIAEHVLGMMLCLVRSYPAHILNQQTKSWHPTEPALLCGQTVGVLGFGAIGQAIGARAKAFGMRVIAVRKHPAPSPCADEVVADTKLDAVLPRVKHLVVALPLTPETDNLLHRERLALLPAGAYFYNIARGKVVDEVALAEFLQSGHLAGAGLDVFVEEPLPAESPLWSMPNVLITPHCAGSLPNYRERALAIFLENLRRWRQGEPLINTVNKQAGY
jgi:phosphoglycerate dehydrogenase-like enzyme